MTTERSFEESESESIAAEESGEQQDERNAPFPIVGIGASAGGLEAFIQLLSHLPADTGMAFVLVQHLDPNQKSLLTEILTRRTKMPVTEVQDGVAVEPNQVYIIPPDAKMILSQGVLQLTPREKIHGKYMPADAFFVSLAADRGSKAIAVVLSGGDGDGSVGLTAIKVAGGITFAQCEASAKFNSMPNTAVATGHVDFVLPPQAIAEQLAEISRHPFVLRPLLATSVEELLTGEDAFPTLFALLLAATGVNFTDYKQTTLIRRLKRRMLLYKMERLEDYVQYLQDNPAEVRALYQEILIHVTHFFRDPKAFQALKERVFPVITEDRSNGSPIRVWVPGCSTGEEVYSIVICLLEFLEDEGIDFPIQVFATDISETAIEKARAGIYRENQMVDVSLERRHSFFVSLNDGYQISKSVRERCIFAKQNLNSDPPFSNLDLISCRNVLIYLGLPLQKQVMPVFYYSLNPTGFLMLGTSESTGEFSDLFTLVDKKYKIYAKKLTSTRLNLSFVTSNYPIAKVNSDKPENDVTWNGFDPQKEADRIVLNRYAPIGVLIDSNMDVLQFRGETSLYLRPAPGKPSFNLLKMAREDLLAALRTAIHQAKTQNIPIRKEGLRLEGSNPSREITIEVIPFSATPAEEHYFLVLFQDVLLSTRALGEVNPEGTDPGDAALEIVHLKQELATAIRDLATHQEYLQAIIQEQEDVCQDLKVANEEILSSNEELQSTNEELETAKEEIQATNEELNTTNEELYSRNLELHQVNNDLTNLLSNVNLPILMLANDLRIRRFTPTAQKMFNLIPTDVGRLFSDIRSNINISDLEPLVLEVIDTLSVKELEVQDQEGHWYSLRIRPYRTQENQIDGAVLVLADIDALKRSAARLEAARNYAEATVETVREPLLVLDSNLRVIRANRSFYETFQVSPLETERQLLFDLGNGQWGIPALRSLLQEILPNNTQLLDFEVEHHFEQIGRKTMRLNARRILQEGDVRTILLAIEDITEQKQLEAERSHLLAQEQLARLASEAARQAADASNQAKDGFLSIVSHELRTPLNAMLGWSQLLRRKSLDEATTTQALETIERSAKAQTQLIEDLLEISRITTGKLRLNVNVIDLVPVIQGAIEVIQLSANVKNIQIDSRLDPETGRVLGDSSRLQQVIWNLLSNAVKFTPPGGRIEVSLEPRDTQAQIHVSDTGQGISADFLPHVFERFRQGDSTTTRNWGGLGLGLTIVRYLVELHGGTVKAESLGEGQGTTMSVRLPLQSSARAVSWTGDVELADPTGRLELPVGDSSLEGLQVLVVDDSIDMLELLTTILRQYGAEVTAIASAGEALSLLTLNPGRYDVLLSDIGMPEQDGYTLIRQVRAIATDAGGQIPAAALTAYARNEDYREARLAGFQMHIAKPVEPAQLALMVATLAGRAPNS